jgi:hypothetical protein
VGSFSTGSSGNGSADFTMISSIVMPSGGIGRNYDFGVVLNGPPTT